MGEEGYRCDGAYGQIVVVLPKRDMIIACQCEVNGMQDELDLIKELVNNLYSDDVVLNLEHKINNVYKIEKSNDVPFNNLKIELEGNLFNFDKLSVERNNNKIKLITLGKESITIEAGNGYYIKNDFYATGIKRKLSDIMPSFYEQIVTSCYYNYNDEKLEIVMKNHNTPLIQSIIVDVKNCLITINNKIIKFNILEKS
jgi:hypothetical protein